MTGVVDTFKKKADERTAEQVARQVEYYVMAGTIRGDVDPVAGIDYPISQSTNVDFSAEVVFSNSGNKCEVIVTAGKDFSHTIEIYPYAIE